MDQVSYNKKRLRGAALATAILFLLLVLGTILQWGIASQWGGINITRVSFVSEGGYVQSGLMFIPEGVNSDNPAPAIINFHGRNNSSYNMINWAMEEARRGYIAFNPDLAGTLETDRDSENTRSRINDAAYSYLQSLDMVTEISVAAHSMGNQSIQDLISREGEKEYKLKNLINVGGTFFWGFNDKIPFPSQTNFLILEGSADIFLVQTGGGYERIYDLIAQRSGLGDDFVIGELYGDPSEGTAFQYIEMPGMTHQGELYSTVTISHILDFIGMSSPAPTPIDNTSMIFPFYQITTACCFVLFLLLIGALGYTVSSLPGIYRIVNTPLPASNGKSKKKWAFHIVTDLLIPVALFVPVTMAVKKMPTDFFVSTWINQILFWLAACAVVSLIFIIVRTLRKRKTAPLTPLDFGFGAEEEKILNWKRIGCALIIGIVVSMVLFGWMDVVFKTTGLNYQFNSMPGQIMRGTPERWVYTMRYLLFMLPVYIIININIATTRRMRTTGNELKDTIRDIVVNIILSAGPLTLLMVIQFGGIRLMGDGTIPLNTDYWDSLAYAWSFPLMMSTCAGVSTFLYRKTGNNWTGIFTSCIAVIAITVFQCTTM